MINNPSNANLGMNNLNNQFVQGTPVYDVDGNQVGTVSEHGVEAGCLVVHHGLLHTDVYVPLGDIRGADAQAVHLSANQDQFNNFSKNQPPANAGATNMGSNYAAPAAAGAAGMVPGTTDWNTSANGQPDTRLADSERATTAGTPRELGDMGQRLDDRLNTAGNTPLGAGDIGIPVVEEQLVGEKQRGEVGRVQVHKEVVEQPETLSAQVTHQELRVEHNPVSDNLSAGDIGDQAFQNQDVEIPLMGEKLDVQKQARVVDELHLHKQDVTETERVQDTVRRERVNIEGADQPLNAQPLNDTTDQNLNDVNAPQQ